MPYRSLFLTLLVSAMLPAQTAKPNLYFFVNAGAFSAQGAWVPVDPKSHAAYDGETQQWR